MIKLLPCDLLVHGLSHGINLLQCKVRLRTIYLIWSNSFLGPRIGRNFVHRLPFFFNLTGAGPKLSHILSYAKFMCYPDSKLNN